MIVSGPAHQGGGSAFAVCQFSSGTQQHGLPAGFVQITHCQTTHISDVVYVGSFLAHYCHLRTGSPSALTRAWVASVRA